MVLESLISFVYDAVAYSWSVAAVAVKYVLLVYLVKLGYEKDLSLESFLEIVERYANETVVGIVTLGVTFSIISIKPEPFLRLLSELIALGYFALLFWRY